MQWAALEIFTPEVLPAFASMLPPEVSALEITDFAAVLRHWNAPSGFSVLAEDSSDLTGWSPATLLAVRQEADQSQRRTLRLKTLRACYYRSALR